MCCMRVCSHTMLIHMRLHVHEHGWLSDNSALGANVAKVRKVNFLPIH